MRDKEVGLGVRSITARVPDRDEFAVGLEGQGIDRLVNLPQRLGDAAAGAEGRIECAIRVSRTAQDGS